MTYHSEYVRLFGPARSSGLMAQLDKTTYFHLTFSLSLQQVTHHLCALNVLLGRTPS
jgi:hypothetical protein